MSLHLVEAPASVRDRLFASEPCISFEFFPPRSDEARAQLERTMDELASFEPGFVSVTWGANGTTADASVETALALRRRGLRVLAHLTCRGNTADELLALARRLAAAGITDVLALRGDPPKGMERYEPAPGEPAHASELVRLLSRSDERPCVGAACYPEGHLECASRELDLVHLKEKVAAGAEFLITQVFYENALYFDFVERCRRAGIHVPILPGIMPITSFDQIERITRMCGATIPRRLQLALEATRGDPLAARAVGVRHTMEQCRELLGRGAPGIHFFTLNRSGLVREILERVGRREVAGRAAGI